MAEGIVILSSLAEKKEKYEALLPQIKSLVQGEADVVANAANIVAALKEVFGFFWIGFYFVKENELVLGPFQGSVACTRISFGKGVCGASWQRQQTIIVDDVDQFPGHIACSSLSKSEIVIPVFKNDKVVAVLDVDSSELKSFDETDQYYLEQVCKVMSNCL